MNLDSIGQAALAHFGLESGSPTFLPMFPMSLLRSTGSRSRCGRRAAWLQHLGILGFVLRDRSPLNFLQDLLYFWEMRIIVKEDSVMVPTMQLQR